MYKFFLDTNIYNHLNDEYAEKLRISKRIEILTTPQILGELVATFKIDMPKTQKLATLYEKIISQRVIKQPPELIRQEVDYINTGQRRSIYLNSEQKKGFRRYIEEFKKGQVSKDTISFVEYVKKKKKENKEFCKKSKEELDHLWDDSKVSAFPDFGSFYKHGYVTGDIRKEIEAYLERIIAPEQRFMIGKIAKIIEKNLHKAPHLAIAIRINPALSYRYHLEKKKAKWRDMEDILNLIAVTTCDAYVSDDEGAREMAEMLFPNKNILSLERFLKELKPIT